MISEKLKNVIRDVPDFPKPGIVFKDITPIMMNSTLSKEVVEHLKNKYKDQGIEAVAGIESRGFLFGYPLAMALNVPFILIRKKGKLPYHKESFAYDLEYGSAEIEMHVDAVSKNQKVLIHDDLLATGGSADAAAHLIRKCGGQVVGFNFLVELEFLEGNKKLNNHSENIVSLVKY
ncbi:MAG: adenine phosphoribosyltransferase [Bacteroidetes bacterium]|nr:adenine phosphoribosyltransferase [Bacteroidota bacterium]